MCEPQLYTHMDAHPAPTMMGLKKMKNLLAVPAVLALVSFGSVHAADAVATDERCEAQVRAVFDELKPAAATVLQFLDSSVEFQAVFTGMRALDGARAEYNASTGGITASPLLCGESQSLRRPTIAHELGHAIPFAQKRQSYGVQDLRGLPGAAYRLASASLDVPRNPDAADPYVKWGGATLTSAAQLDERLADVLGGAILRVAGERHTDKGQVSEFAVPTQRWEMFRRGFDMMDRLDLASLMPAEKQMKVQRDASGRIFLRAVPKE